jgi:cysteine desulfurase
VSYLDAASSEPLHPVARETMLAALDAGWADPARLYRDGRRARMLLDGARETVAATIGAAADEIVFTASGTQAVHLGVLGVLAGRRRAGAHLVTSAVEHSSVLHAAQQHERGGGTVSRVGVDRLGHVAPSDVAAALRPDTALACLQSANHEVGSLQPVTEAAEATAARGVPLLVDAAQSVGRLQTPTGWSVLTASAHKWGGPAGVGVLAVRRGTLTPSHVLEAMGVLSHGNVRVSLPRGARADHVDAFLAAVPQVVASLRRAVDAEGL